MVFQIGGMKLKHAKLKVGGEQSVGKRLGVEIVSIFTPGTLISISDSRS